MKQPTAKTRPRTTAKPQQPQARKKAGQALGPRELDARRVREEALEVGKRP